MGLLGRMFGGGRSKTDLVRDLVKLRVASDPMAQASGLTPDAVDSLSKMRLNMLPEAGIVATTDKSYYEPESFLSLTATVLTSSAVRPRATAAFSMSPMPSTTDAVA